MYTPHPPRVHVHTPFCACVYTHVRRCLCMLERYGTRPDRVKSGPSDACVWEWDWSGTGGEWEGAGARGGGRDGMWDRGMGTGVGCCILGLAQHEVKPLRRPSCTKGRPSRGVAPKEQVNIECPLRSLGAVGGCTKNRNDLRESGGYRTSKGLGRKLNDRPYSVPLCAVRQARRFDD